MQRLTSAISRTVSDSEVTQISIDFLAFENANPICNKVIRHLETRSSPAEEWIRNTTNVGSHVYDFILIGEVISQQFKKS